MRYINISIPVNMKKFIKFIAVSALLLTGSMATHAQFYQIANQIPGLIRPALSGSLNYKGFVDASYLAGLGNYKIDFLNFSTSQGFRYANWFYMGVGVGVDVAFTHPNNDFGQGIRPGNPYWEHSSTTTGVMVPVFTDFRFNIGGVTKPSFFADIRLGASFLMTDSYLQVGDGFITNREYFYLKPSIGLRIPVSSSGKSAVDIGVVYQLLTSNYWYNYPGNITISALGGTIGFEW